jgi:hypothetical protein
MFARQTLLAAAGLTAVLAASPAFADTAKSLGKFGDWQSFAYSDKAGKVCYAASSPKRSTNNPKGRGDAFVTITHRPSDKSFDVVSITAGYTFKKDAAVEIDVGGSKFDLYTQADTAWSRADKAVVAAMAKSKSLVVHGSPVKGEATVDTYSLDGFPKALAEINKACGVK